MSRSQKLLKDTNKEIKRFRLLIQTMKKSCEPTDAEKRRAALSGRTPTEERRERVSDQDCKSYTAPGGKADAYAKTWALVQQDINKANNFFANQYTSIYQHNIDTLQNAMRNADKNFEQVSKSKNAASIWSGLPTAMLLAVISSVPGAGPCVTLLTRASSSKFVQETIKNGVTTLNTHLATFAIKYKGPKKPSAKAGKSLPELIQAIRNQTTDNQKVYSALQDAWQRAWKKNNTAKPIKGWGNLLFEEVVKQTFVPPARLTLKGAEKALEKVLWDRYLKEVEAAYHPNVFSAPAYSFNSDKLSRSAVRYLRKRYKLSLQQLHAMCKDTASQSSHGTLVYVKKQKKAS